MEKEFIKVTITFNEEQKQKRDKIRMLDNA